MTETSASTLFDVIVVGAGMVGCSTALFAAEAGLRVALLDEAGSGLGTSNNSFAWINATSKTADESYHRLNALGASGYRALAAEWGEARIGLHPTGMLQWAAPDDPAALAVLDQRYEALTRWGYPVAKVGYDDLRALEPHVVFVPGSRGLHAIADAWLDVPTFIRFAHERVEATGGEVLERAAAKELLLDDDGTIEGIRTTQRTLRAPTVVIATGPGTPEVLEQLTGYEPFRTRFPMQRVPGLLVRTPTLPPWRFAHRILYCNEGDVVHVRPTPDGGLLLGADDTDAAASAPDDRAGIRAAATTLLARAERLIPKFPGPALLGRCELKVGVRPVPADGHSIVGAMPGSPGLHIALTHSGVTLGPAIGRLLAESICTGTTPPALEPFGFDRFQSP